MTFEALMLPFFDPGTGTVMLPWWVVATFAAVLVAALLMTVLRGGPAIVVGGVVGATFLALVVTVAWVGSERVAARERAEERRALLTRAQDLAKEAATPGSVLACLDAVAGETVEGACERALFESPETVAGATAYTAARLALLTDGMDYAVRTNTSYDAVVPRLRAGLEADRFGFVAQVLAFQYGCTADNCNAFTLFRETKRINANLRERPFDLYVAKHAANWATRRAPLAASAGPGRASPVPPGFNVPSAASIPPVNIMVPEPSASGAANSVAAPADATTSTPPRRRAAQPKPARPAPANPNAPVQIVPTAPPAANTGSAARAQ
jgi:hypothetical protein